MSVDRAIETAIASVEMDGYQIDERSRIWCTKLLNHEITFEQYLELIKKKAGVLA